MTKRQKFTIIHYVSVGMRAGQFLAAMKRVETANLRAYIERHDLDVAFIFEGWPKKEA